MASIVVPGIWRSLGLGSVPPSVSQCRSYSDTGLDGCVAQISEPSSSGDPLVDTLRSVEFPPSIPKVETSGADSPVVDRNNAYPARRYKGYRVSRTANSESGRVGQLRYPILKPQLTNTGLKEEERPVGNYKHASRNVTQEFSEDDSSTQGFVSGKELSIDSDSGHGNRYLQNTNTTTQAIAILKHRIQQGLYIDTYMVVDILKQCSKQKDLTAATQVHNCIIQSGMDRHPHVATTLLHVYVKCGRLQIARQVFDGLEKTHRNVTAWTVMIGAYAASGCGVEAYRLFLQMKREGVLPNSFTYTSILNPSASGGALEWVKEVHSDATKAGLESDLRVGSALVHMYAKSGSIEDARLVFDRLEKRDVITWNVIIGAYAGSGNGGEAYRLFLQMKREGFIPTVFTYASILNASASAGALEWVKEVHRDALMAGVEFDLRLGNALVHMYAKSGSLDDARLAFDRLEKRDVITWTVIIGAYAESGCGVEAYGLFLEMKREGFKPNAFTYTSLLNSFASAGALEWVKEVHSDALKAGLESDLRVGSALVQMYAKSGSIDDARLVFDRLERRDVMTWNLMIEGYAESGCGVEAYRLFLEMKREGFIPNSFTYASVLNASASAGDLDWVKEIHSDALKAGLESDLLVSNALVHVYAKSGSIDDARLVFDRMEKSDTITWNVMIGAYASSGNGGEAYRLFLEMKREGFIPNSFTYTNILNASAIGGAFEWVREVHRDALRAGLESDLRVGSALIHMYAKSGSIDDSRLVFDRLERRDVMTWNLMIGAYAENGCGVEAYRLFLQMKREGFIPNKFTYGSILNASASAGALEWVKEVHSDALEARLESDLYVGSALVHMYAKSGSIDDARLVFDRLERRDVMTWNLMIEAYAESGCGVEAYRLFLQMKREGLIPNSFTYTSILNSSASAGALEWVEEVHRDALKAGLESDLAVGNALVHMYAKSGSIDDARLVFDRMEKRDVITWTAMIGGLAEHGYAHEALELFKRMNVDSVKPNEITFVALLTACSHGGLVDDGSKLFRVMTQDYGIEPTVVHYTCMVDLLGRAGHLEEAKLLIADMPIEANGATWVALLGACRTYGNVELGELTAKEVLKLEPKNASACVLLSNIYAAAGRWEKVSWVRRMMQETGVQKDPGRSWIEADNKIHEFVVGDTSHPEAKAIYSVLKNLTEDLKAEGYTPDTQLVSQDICEEDKELVLCSHSEKLAIAYGIHRIPGRKPIRIFKNLRVCSDCHTATKLISKVTGREIIARDASRFHHFKDGVCSCNDYW